MAAASPTTAGTLIRGALQSLGVLDAAEVPSAEQAQDGLRRLNAMIGQWALQSLTIPSISRLLFTLTANKGGPSNPYTIGTGGDLNTPRPNNIVNVGLILGGTSPAVEIPRTLLTDQAYEAIAIKELTSPLFTSVYYRPTTALNRGTIYLWPVPDNALHQLVLYIPLQLSEFTNLTDSYYVPDGYPEAIEYQLALRLAPTYQVTVSPDLRQLARDAYATIKRTNTDMSDLATDPALTTNNRIGYNIVTGQGG